MKSSKLISFSIQWILVTTVIYAIVTAMTWGQMDAVVATAQETLFGGLFMSGLFCGLGQSRLIENQSPGIAGESWIIINIIGMPLGVILGFYVYSGFESPLLSGLRNQYLPIHWLAEPSETAFIGGTFFFAGIFLGILQWLVLRRKVEGAYWWIPVSGLSWSFGFYLTFKIKDILLPVAWYGHHFRIGGLIGIIFGVIMGTAGAVAIGRMLNNPKQSSQQIESTLSTNAS